MCETTKSTCGVSIQVPQRESTGPSRNPIPLSRKLHSPLFMSRDTLPLFVLAVARSDSAVDIKIGRDDSDGTVHPPIPAVLRNPPSS